MPKIAFIGGGSAKFVRDSVVDILNFEELGDCHFSLMDIDRERVERTERLVRKMISERGVPATVESTLDRRRALDGADYVVITLMIGGLRYYESDSAIPARHGVFQAVGDTTGPGAVFRLVRTAPVLAGIVRDVKELAPNAWILNYANPMPMLTEALIAYGHERSVGLCHAIQGGIVWHMAKWLDLPAEEIEYEAAGINHVCFYTKLMHKGRDLYPVLKADSERIIKRADAYLSEGQELEHVRFELLKYLGYFPCEGPWHQGEYYPWFRKTQALVDHYGPKTGWAYDFDLKLNAFHFEAMESQIAGTEPIDWTPSLEYGAPIIHSMETGVARKVYANLRNEGAITNLPDAALVEVPCTVDGDGLHRDAVGDLPPQLAAVMMPHIYACEMAVRGVMQKDRTLIRQALQADPLTGAALTLPQIDVMTNDMFAENRAFMEDWA
jgi:alpha-galactosidase